MYIYLSRRVRIGTVLPVFLLFCYSVSGAVLCTSCFAAVMLHELGHLISGWALGCGTDVVTLTPLGADIRLSRVVSYREEIVIALTGPVFGIVFGGLGVLLYNIFGFEFFKYFYLCSFCYGILNLIPVGVLDGGRALKAFCLFHEAKRLYDFISVIFLFILWLLGVFILFYTSFNASLLLFCCVIFYGAYVKER